MQKSKNVLIVSVHPDDETLGCGGTILKHKSEGDAVYCVFITNGNEFQKTTIPLLKDCYGFNGIFSLELPEIILDTLPLKDIITPLSKVINEVKPEIIYLPNRSDTHSDHRKVFEAAQACTKSFRYPFIRKVLMCEIMSETDFMPALPELMFIPNVFVDISEFFERQMEIMKIFKSELFEPPFTRSLEAIKAHKTYRGSQINSYYAECFMLIKEIWKDEN
jgi:N-acetylglucosamine malate deacetylase 1